MKHYLQMTILCLLALTSCQKDNLFIDETAVSENGKFQISRVETLDYSAMTNERIKQKVAQLKIKKRSMNSQGLTRENWDEIAIDTSSVQLTITEDGYESYTFDVLNTEASNYIENIVISHYPNDSLSVVLATYYLNASLGELGLFNIEESITHSKFTLLDDTTEIIESQNDMERADDCIVVGYWEQFPKCEGGEAGLGSDMCNDENGQPIMISVFVVIADSCDWDDMGFDGNPVNGSGANSNTNNTEDDDTENGGSGSGGPSDTDGYDNPFNYVVTVPKINFGKELIHALDLDKYQDVLLINWINSNYQSFEGNHSAIMEAYAYLVINEFSSEAKSLILELLEMIMNNTGLTFSNALNSYLLNSYASILQDGDTIAYNPNVNSLNAFSFDSLEDFVNYTEDVDFELNTGNSILSGGRYSTKFKVNIEGGISYMNISVNQKLRDDTTGQAYEIIEVVSSHSGFTFGLTWEQTSTSNDYVVVGNTAIINLEGLMHYNLFFNGIGTVYSEFIHYELIINIETGEAISITKIDN
ncbi:hypothetical protein ACU8DI_12740 [Psychroserpens sp. BH13MA-6]